VPVWGKKGVNIRGLFIRFWPPSKGFLRFRFQTSVPRFVKVS